MRLEQEQGRVRPLHRDIPELCKWYGAWWLHSADGWLRITDSHLAGRLDRIKMRLDIAEEARACYRSQDADDAVGRDEDHDRAEEEWLAW